MQRFKRCVRLEWGLQQFYQNKIYQCNKIYFWFAAFVLDIENFPPSFCLLNVTGLVLP